MRTMGTPKSTTKHELTDLVGKKIMSIHLHEVDVAGDGTNIRQFFRIQCAGDGAQLILACDGGHEEQQYATASLMDPEEFEVFLEDLREDSEDSEDEYDPEDDPFNEDLSEDDLFVEDEGYDED